MLSRGNPVTFKCDEARSNSVIKLNKGNIDGSLSVTVTVGLVFPSKYTKET